MKKIAIVLVILAIVASGSYLYFSRTGKAKKEEGELYVVRRGRIVHSTEQTGIIKPQVGSIVNVGTRATGTLVKLNYRVGDFVHKGALIAKIDDREIRVNMEATKAQIERLKKDLEAKRAQLEYARANYEREMRLLEKDFTTRDKVELAKRDVEVLSLEIESQKAAIREAEERLKALEVDLTYTEVHAPISGYVTSVATQEGETIVAGLSAVNLITIVDPRRLELRIYVDETDIGKVKKDMRVEYWVDAYRDRVFTGKIDLLYLQPEMKENIVYYLAIVKIPERDAVYLRPDMTAHARIIVEEKQNVLVIPTRAITYEDGRFFVVVSGGEGPQKREVKVGIRDERMTEVLSGLREGETILLRGARKPPKR
jgi:RND family efflux transporter MFP subunit